MKVLKQFHTDRILYNHYHLICLNLCIEIDLINSTIGNRIGILNKPKVAKIDLIDDEVEGISVNMMSQASRQIELQKMASIDKKEKLAPHYKLQESNSKVKIYPIQN